IESQALLNAESQAQTILDAWTLYSSAAVERIEKIKGITVTHNYLVKDGAIPIPATYAIELGKNLSQDGTGFSVRLYSDYPFPWRKAKGG
ncbi:MAG: adenylate/guanylate cyclase domain-containing protein, partial [Nostoc sp.]